MSVPDWQRPQRDNYPKVDFEAIEQESWMWVCTNQLRWFRPHGGDDNDLRLEQLWERTTGERTWRVVNTMLEG